MQLLSVDSLGKSYISVKWINPNGKRDFIGVSYGNTQSLATLKVNQDSHTQLERLDADTVYTLYIYTKSGNRESTRKTIYIHTSESIVFNDMGSMFDMTPLLQECDILRIYSNDVRMCTYMTPSERTLTLTHTGRLCVRQLQL